MKKFNEWLEDSGAGLANMSAYGAGSGSVNDVGAGMMPSNDNTNEPTPEQIMAELRNGDASSYLRLIQRITGQRVFTSALVQALRRAITAAPGEMTNFLSIVGNMTVGQQNRASKGMTNITQK